VRRGPHAAPACSARRPISIGKIQLSWIIHAPMPAALARHQPWAGTLDYLTASRAMASQRPVSTCSPPQSDPEAVIDPLPTAGGQRKPRTFRPCSSVRLRAGRRKVGLRTSNLTIQACHKRRPFVAGDPARAKSTLVKLLHAVCYTRWIKGADPAGWVAEFVISGSTTCGGRSDW